MTFVLRFVIKSKSSDVEKRDFLSIYLRFLHLAKMRNERKALKTSSFISWQELVSVAVATGTVDKTCLPNH